MMSEGQGEGWANHAKFILEECEYDVLKKAKEMMSKYRFYELPPTQVWHISGELEKENILYWEKRGKNLITFDKLTPIYPWYSLIKSEDPSIFLRGIKMARFWGDFISYFSMEGIIRFFEEKFAREARALALD